MHHLMILNETPKLLSQVFLVEGEGPHSPYSSYRVWSYMQPNSVGCEGAWYQAGASL